MTAAYWIVIACGVLALLYGMYAYRQVMAAPAGNARMQEIAAAVQEGAQAYLNRQYTTIAIVATDADLSKAQLKRLSVAAQDGMARAVSPSHSAVDGDIVFAVSTGSKPVKEPIYDMIALGHAAAVCLARAIARAVYFATPAENDHFPTWQQKWGGR